MSDQMNQMILNQGLEYRQTKNGLEQNSKYFKTQDTFQNNTGALFSLFEPFVEGIEDEDGEEDAAPAYDCPFGDDASLCDTLQSTTPSLVIKSESQEVNAAVKEYNKLLANYIIIYSKIHSDKAKYDAYFNPNRSSPWIYSTKSKSNKIGFLLKTGYLMQQLNFGEFTGENPVYTRGSRNVSSGKLHACKTFSNILYGSKLITKPPKGFWRAIQSNLNRYVTVSGSNQTYYIDKMGIANDVTENTHVVLPDKVPGVEQQFIDSLKKRPMVYDIPLKTYADIITSTEIFNIDDYLTLITTNSSLQTILASIIAGLEAELVASQESTAGGGDDLDGEDLDGDDLDGDDLDGDDEGGDDEGGDDEGGDDLDGDDEGGDDEDGDDEECDEATAGGGSTGGGSTGGGSNEECKYPFNNCTPSGCTAGKCPKMGADCDYKCDSTCCCYDSQCTGTGGNIQDHQQQLHHDQQLLHDIKNSVPTLQQQNTNSELTFNKSRYVYILWVILAIIVAIVIFKKL
jgi:hypothetical protein